MIITPTAARKTARLSTGTAQLRLIAIGSCCPASPLIETDSWVSMRKPTADSELEADGAVLPDTSSVLDGVCCSSTMGVTRAARRAAVAASKGMSVPMICTTMGSGEKARSRSRSLAGRRMPSETRMNGVTRIFNTYDGFRRAEELAAQLPPGPSTLVYAAGSGGTGAGATQVLCLQHVIDSLKAILELSYNEFQKLYGWSSERAMVYTRISTGRSPMVALRVTNLKPGLIVLHGLPAAEIDPIAAKIAEIERVPLIATIMPLNELIRALQSYDMKH